MGKFRKYLRGEISEDNLLTTLAAKTGVKNAVTDVVTEPAWLSSVKASWALKNNTVTAGAGPILVGIAHVDYTLAEIEEWLENAQSWSVHDLRQQEIARRKIRKVGIFPNLDELGSQVLNDGKPIRTKCGWMINTGDTIAIWAYNTGTTAIATSAPILHTEGHANLWPK